MPVTLSLASMPESLASKYNNDSKKYFNQMACKTIYQNKKHKARGLTGKFKAIHCQLPFLFILYLIM